MLNTLRHNVHFTGLQGDCAVPHLNVQAAFQYQKEIIRLVVLVPRELPFDFDHHHVQVVQLSNRARRPVIGERSQFLRQINFVLRGQYYFAFFNSTTITWIGLFPTTESVCMVPGLLLVSQ